jgi:hypothetical protein
MNKLPTAEEVLGLYLDYVNAMTFYKSGPSEGADTRWEMVCRAMLTFDAKLKDWRAAQGPVTREWFVERFGRSIAYCKKGSICHWQDCVEVLQLGKAMCFDNPTRSDIETLVGLLGGVE